LQLQKKLENNNTDSLSQLQNTKVTVTDYNTDS